MEEKKVVAKKKFSEMTIQEKLEHYQNKARNIKSKLNKENRELRKRWLIMLGALNLDDGDRNPEKALEVVKYLESKKAKIREGDKPDYDSFIAFLKGVKKEEPKPAQKSKQDEK